MHYQLYINKNTHLISITLHGYFQEVGRVLLKMVPDALARFERLAVEQVHLVLGKLQQVLGEVGGGGQTHVPLVEVE